MLRAAAQAVVFLVFFAAILFVSAGRADWPMAWAFLAVYLAFVVLAFVLLDPELIHERSHFESGGNREDVIIASIMFVWLFPLTLLVAGLDVGRFHWSPTVPLGVQIVALGLFAVGNAIGFRAMMANRFFSDFVRIQTERGHHVVTNGPYAVVRHPGYAGGILLAVALPVALGSLVALIPALIGSSLLILRMLREERMLKEELNGYRDYVSRVRWRLCPGIW